METLFVENENKLAQQALAGHYGPLTVDTFDAARELRAASAVNIGNHHSVFVDALPPEAIERYRRFNPVAKTAEGAAAHAEDVGISAETVSSPAARSLASEMDAVVAHVTGADVGEPEEPVKPLYIPPTNADLSWVPSLMRGGLRVGVVAPVLGAKTVDPLAAFADIEAKVSALAEADQRALNARQKENKRLAFSKSPERSILCRAVTESSKKPRHSSMAAQSATHEWK